MFGKSETSEASSFALIVDVVNALVGTLVFIRDPLRRAARKERVADCLSAMIADYSVIIESERRPFNVVQP